MAPRTRNYNGWLPSSRAVYDSFVNDIVRSARSTYSTNGGMHEPPVQKFKEAIEANPAMVKLFDKIFLQVSPLNKVKSFNELLTLFDVIVVVPPKFKIADDGGREVAEPVGVPMYLLFDLLANTGAAYDLFRMKEFNVAIKELLNSWGNFLKTHDSSSTLNNEPEGWFGEAAMKVLEEGRGTFNETYVVPKPEAPNRGYNSWDEFFVRQIKPEARPIVPAPFDKVVIYNSCESTVERVATNVKAHDQFWLKGMNYSLYDMFDGDTKTADHFVGGTVYHAFLSPQDYHRWHCPAAGTVVDARVVPGTYYAVLPDEGEEKENGEAGDPRGALIRSQPWLTMSATRAIITIQADSPAIGLYTFIGVGMAEVSTCEVVVEKGQKLKAGDQIGMFHFGGSTHTLIFGPKTKVTFSDEVVTGNHIHVNRILGGVEL